MSILYPQSKSKLPDLQTSIFTVMGQLANKHNAINLSQGFPNFEPDPNLINLVTKAMNEGYNQYAPMAGIYSLRERISDKIKSLYNTTYNPESEITITAGATQAIFTVIAAFVSPKDEVIVLKPAYDCYEPAILAAGGIPILKQLKGNDFKIDWIELQEAITDRTKMIVINSPHNPSGTVLSSKDLNILQDLLRNTGILLLSDEVYEHIVFEPFKHESVAKYPDLASRSFICASFGKIFHTTGWKMGYVAAPDQLMKEFRKIHEFNVFCVNHPMQRALATYLENPQNYLELSAFFKEKRDYFLDAIKGSRFSFTPSEGTYFQLLDYSDITDERDVDFAKRLTIEKNLASIPISVFNLKQEDNKQLRFCFAKTRETLEKAAQVILTI